jgi:hypothetical protein
VARQVVQFDEAAHRSNHPNLRRATMGDKSPKSNERKKKQDSAEKDKKKADAYTKAHPAPAVPAKKGR